MHQIKSLVALVGTTLLFGCDPDLHGIAEDGSSMTDFLDEEGRISWRNIQDNGVENNGVRWNGVRWNGVRWNGVRWNGVRWNGVRWNGEDLVDPSMIGNQIRALTQQGQEKVGPDLEGAVLDADILVDGVLTPVEFRLTSVSPIATPSGVSVDGLLIEQRELPSGSWVNVCENNAPAVSLQGDWDVATGDKISSSSDASTWACLGAALGDCAGWGYVPGATFNGHSLSAYHQACTRAKRADYVGDGGPHTSNGTAIDIYDRLGMQVPGTSWGVEALYNENGVVCISTPRKTNFTRAQIISKAALKGKSLSSDGCVDADNDGDLFDDYPTALIAIRNVPTSL
ncbi:MAG: hypothetical protein IPK80_25645 [Nannocystis sp.]|nr:hypothetical protein [Nannocystis sp.]